MDCILNRTLIDAQTNRRIGKRAPADYLKEIADELGSELGPDAFQRLMSSHLLAGAAKDALIQNDFKAFVETRQQRIAEEMATVTQVATLFPEDATEDAA